MKQSLMGLTILAIVISIWLSGTLEKPALAAGIDINTVKKEAGLVFYTATRASDADETIRKFTEKYPFIKGNYYRAGGAPLLQRILTEARGAKHLWDVVSALGPQVIMLEEKGLLAPYKSIHQSFYPKGFYDPDGYWTDTYDLYITVAYNTKMVPSSQVPRRWEDLFDPRWKDGKICLDERRDDWFAGMMEAMGPQKGKIYMERLRSQKPIFRQGNTLIVQLMAAGEFPLAITYAHSVEQMKAIGAPIDWVAMEPMIAITEPIALSKHARHPNVGKLFIDFVLSKEGAELLKSQRRVPARLDVDPLTKRLDPRNLKLHPVNISSERLDQEGFRAFFGFR